MTRQGTARGIVPRLAAWGSVCIGLLSFAGDSPFAAVTWPVGKSAGAVAFDCVIEEDAPLAGTRTALFLEYAVSPQAIAYDIVWAEPCWGTIHFPCPPTGTSLYADKSRFVVRHELNDVEWKHSLPDAPRGVFRHTCGNYPIDESRFALQQATARRLTVGDIPAIERAARPFEFDSPLEDRPGMPPARVITRDLSDDRIRFIISTQERHEAWTSEYRSREGKLESLRCEHTEVKVAVAGFEIHAKTPDFPDGVVIDRLSARRHAGGRAALVEFAPRSIGGVDVDLPTRIRVGTYDSAPGGLNPLRRATMSNYRGLEAMPTAETVGRRFASDPLFDREQMFRRHLATWWNRPVADVDPADAAWLRTFADDCLGLARDEPRLPIRLKLLFMAIASDLMLGNDSRVDGESLPAHDRTLREAGLGAIADLAAAQLADIRATWGRVEGDSEE
jgi:hypothetical protein